MTPITLTVKWANVIIRSDCLGSRYIGHGMGVLRGYRLQSVANSVIVNLWFRCDITQ